ncbi:MAG TPA: hypothetical protein VH835_01075 [Dongiaceae bacterium]|jgi:hypothetical protein
MTIVMRIIITVVFGLLWWWVYNRVGADLHYLMILGSVLAICVCCCKGSSDPGQWNWDRYFACIRRCWLPTLVLIISLFIIGVLAVIITLGAGALGAVILNILLAAIFAPLFVRFICCAYENA